MKRPGPDLIRLRVLKALLDAKFEHRDILMFMKYSERTFYRDVAHLRRYADLGHRLD